MNVPPTGGVGPVNPSRGEPSQTTVTRELKCAVVGIAGGPVNFLAELQYRVTDPYATTITFRPNGSAGDAVPWHVGRELLMTAVAPEIAVDDTFAADPSLHSESAAIGPTNAMIGDGDLKLMRPRFQGGPVTLFLNSRGDAATIEVDAHQLKAFLDATQKVCPVGEESKHLDVDAAIAQIFEA